MNFNVGDILIGKKYFVCEYDSDNPSKAHVYVTYADEKIFKINGYESEFDQNDDSLFNITQNKDDAYLWIHHIFSNRNKNINGNLADYKRFIKSELNKNVKQKEKMIKFLNSIFDENKD